MKSFEQMIQELYSGTKTECMKQCLKYYSQQDCEQNYCQDNQVSTPEPPEPRKAEE